MSYGLSIPPKWYRDRTPQQYTKQGLIVALYRAFLTVGMIPIRGLSPAGIDLDGQTSESSWGLRIDTQWFLDYPTSETFTIAGIAYRPIIVLGTVGGDGDGNYTGDATNLQVAIYNGFRRADRAVRADVNTFGMYRVANLGFGSNSSNQYSLNGNESFNIAINNWKQHATSVDPNRTVLLPIANLHVILGPAGLLVQAGNGVDKTDNNNILNVAFAFGGTRIPGRGRIPAQDPLLGTTNPVVTLRLNQNVPGSYATNAQNETWSSFGITKTSYSGNGIGAWILGASYDLKATVQPVYGYCFNLENIERPLFPVGQSTSLGSPRVASPASAHVLNRLVYVLWNRWTTAGEYYSPVDPNIRPEPTPAWADVWTCEGIRFSDLTAPAGEFTDPVTAKTWFSFRTSYVGQMAFETTGRTVYGAFSYALPSQLGDDYYSLASAGFASTFPSDVSWTPTSTTLIPDAGIDQMTATYNTTAGNLVAAISGPQTDPPGTYYKVSCDLYNRATAGAGGNVNPLHFQYSTDNGSSWTTLVTAYCAGTNTGGTHYNFVNTGDLGVPKSADGKIYLRWVHSYDTGGYGNITHRVRNLHIKRFG